MSTVVELSPSSMEQVARLVAERLAVLREPSPTCRTSEVMHLLGCKSPAALYRLTAELGIVPYAQGRYRRLDVMNAIGRRALTAAKDRKNAKQKAAA